MRDGIQLFHASHANLTAAGALSLTTLGEAFALLRTQTSIGGGNVGTSPRFLVTGPTNEMTARELLVKVGPADGGLPVELIVDTRTSRMPRYYVFASPALLPAWASGHVGERAAPTLMVRNRFRIDGTGFRASTDFGTGPADWRPVVKGPGV